MTEPTYRDQTQANEHVFDTILKETRPDLFALKEIMEETHVNWSVLWRIARALGNVAVDTRYGQVIIEIEDNTVRFIRGVHSSKVNESLTLEAGQPVEKVK
jgi:U3 small nucleolar ribonucleoprotein component